jgi:hypothetical protein
MLYPDKKYRLAAVKTSPRAKPRFPDLGLAAMKLALRRCTAGGLYAAPSMALACRGSAAAASVYLVAGEGFLYKDNRRWNSRSSAFRGRAEPA